MTFPLVHERATEANGRKAPLVTWLFEPGMFSPVAKIEGRKRFGVVSDHLGVPTALMTEAGKIAWQAQLDVYGVPRESSPVGDAAAGETERTGNPWRFPGQYEDPETGLFYNRFRYYDPEIGRYISEDPIGLIGGAELFAYVDDPMTWVDPSGLKPCKIPAAVRKAMGPKPEAMAKAGLKPHLHHIVMETASHLWKDENRKFILDAQEILKRHGIDLHGVDNLVWAPNKGHTVEYAEKVWKALNSADPGGRAKVIEALKDLGAGLAG
ncbi:MAG: RHS repeat-associated core domain-containing protein [Polyangiaceae bacterium]